MSFRPLLFSSSLVVVSALVGILSSGCSSDDANDELVVDDLDLNAKPSLFANDVSIVFPLPKGRDVERLLGATSAGAKGELVPTSVFAKLPPLTPRKPKREDLRVVSLRIDPCFPGLGVEEPAGCKNQIRLILQPVDASTPEDTIDAQDAAIHAFYTMPRQEFGALAREIYAAKRGARGSVRTALGVHPLLDAQGPDGPFAKDVKAAVLKHAGASNLTRVTFMTREPPRQPLWKFGGFDIEGTRVTKMKIASLGAATEQTVGGLMRSLTVTPPIAAKSPDDLSLLLREAEAALASKDDVAQAYGATLRIANPTMHSPDTIDCVSCHTATSSKIWAEKNQKQKPDENPAAFSSRFNTSLSKSPSSERVDNLHAFGYLGKDLSISQRTANESAVVAEYVNTKILRSR